MADFDQQLVLQAFPKLKSTTWQLTSPETPLYNCVAWAVGEQQRWWWPTDAYYWPPGVVREASLESFVTAFVALGFELARSPDVEPGYQKMAIFANELGPTHVARQLDDGKWTSKLGQSVDISHELLALEGPLYGNVRQVMRRPN